MNVWVNLLGESPEDRHVYNVRFMENFSDFMALRDELEVEREKNNQLRLD